MQTLRFPFSQNAGFTLIELLTVMVVIGILTALVLPNMVGMRQRARDTQLKSEMKQLKTALQLYYSDFQKFPAAGTAPNEGEMMGCGINGVEVCSWGSEFSATVNSVEKIYMEQLPTVNDANGTMTYSQPGSIDQTYLVGVTLENASDSDISESMSQCGIPAADDTELTTYYICP